MTRAAILISRSRSVVNSARASGCGLGYGVAHREQQPVGGGVEQQAHLVGERRAATGAVGGKLALVQLDQVLRLATLAIQRVVQPLGAAALDVGHDVADVQAVAARLDARAHAPLTFPGFGAAACLGVAPHQRRLAFGVAHPHVVGDLLDLPIQHIVAGEAKDEVVPSHWTVFAAELSLVLVIVRPPVSPSRPHRTPRQACARLM